MYREGCRPRASGKCWKEFPEYLNASTEKKKFKMHFCLFVFVCVCAQTIKVQEDKINEKIKLLFQILTIKKILSISWNINSRSN